MDDKTLNLWRQIEASRRAEKRQAPGRAKSATPPEPQPAGT
jgi:hypothetical protein